MFRSRKSGSSAFAVLAVAWLSAACGSTLDPDAALERQVSVCPALRPGVDPWEARLDGSVEQRAAVAAYTAAAGRLAVAANDVELSVARACRQWGQAQGIARRKWRERAGPGGRARGACGSVLAAMTPASSPTSCEPDRVTLATCETRCSLDASAEATAFCRDTCDALARAIAVCPPSMSSGSGGGESAPDPERLIGAAAAGDRIEILMMAAERLQVHGAWLERYVRSARGRVESCVAASRSAIGVARARLESVRVTLDVERLEPREMAEQARSR